MLRNLILTTSLAALATSAMAADRGIYVNAKFGRSNTSVSFSDTFDQVIDGEEDSRAYEVGFRFSNLLGIQVGYHDLDRVPGFGVPCTSTDPVCVQVVTPLTGETTAYSAALVPQIALTRSFTLFGKVGVVVWESQVNVVLEDSSEFLDDFTGEDLIYGAGIRLRLIGPIAVFYEYEFIGDDIESQYLGVSIVF